MQQRPVEYSFGGATCWIFQQPIARDTSDAEATSSEVWPGGLALARYFERQAVQWAQDSPEGLSVLELGAGTGLVGLAARALGARQVLLTDTKGALPWLRQNVALNEKLGGDIMT